jgi:hypothetical protein
VEVSGSIPLGSIRFAFLAHSEPFRFLGESNVLGN